MGHDRATILLCHGFERSHVLLRGSEINVADREAPAP
jgi:hypothetical protein